MMIQDTTLQNRYFKTPTIITTAIWQMPWTVTMETSIDNWTHCLWCWVRRDHIWDAENKVWRCGTCGEINWELTRMRRSLTDVAERYLRDNPEE